MTASYFYDAGAGKLKLKGLGGIYNVGKRGRGRKRVRGRKKGEKNRLVYLGPIKIPP